MSLGLHFICHNLVAYRTRKLNYIAKTTGRCAQYMGALKNFDNIQGAAKKSKPLSYFVNISTTNRNFCKKIYDYLSFISTYNCRIILNYHNI